MLIIAQIMRAFLLASATAATLTFLRASNCTTQGRFDLCAQQSGSQPRPRPWLAHGVPGYLSQADGLRD
ncbi:hypothetical protein A8V01_26135 [Novosphingobium guangzhouense]|uniref:Secreted protein n=1 Tax=Novosphingobium guangzhouense TaxID=1850347 RepID=A0A2K2FV26_9SPHN|nr:hypothetical protein A8V01_26135 [Novosphingobium guangzhouense]